MNKEQEKIKIKEKPSWIGTFFMVLTFALLLTILYMALSYVNGLQYQTHVYTMKELELEKEIKMFIHPLTMNNHSINWECEYRLMNLTNHYNNLMYNLQNE